MMENTMPATPTPRQRALVAAVLACLAGGVAAESATVTKDTEMRAQPAATAEEVGKLKAKDTVEVAGRQGVWSNVTTSAGVTGWARVFNLRMPPSATTKNAGGANLGALFATGSSGATSTTGARGLNANDLMQASPDATELAQLDGFASNDGDARGFAAQVPVNAQQVPYLPEGRGGRRSR
jgi:hypothetical protein